MEGPIDLGLGVLDHQLVGADGRECGKVDDLELSGLGDGRPRVTAILVGAAALRHRGLLGRLAAKLALRRLVRVPWEEVAQTEANICLRKSARELRLGRGDDRMRRLVERLPGAR